MKLREGDFATKDRSPSPAAVVAEQARRPSHTDDLGAVVSPVRHLYIHIPFCPHICPYCSFHVLPVQKEGAARLLGKLIREYRAIENDLDPETIFLGGGTPTALSVEMLEELLTVIIGSRRPSTRTGISRGLTEVTCECNPSTLSPRKAEALLRLGVNRLSIGAQSFDPVVLTTLGRTHSTQAITSCVATARAAGFSNINLDLIFGVPGQTLDSWRCSLETALDQAPQHLSCYNLTYEEDTVFFIRQRKGELKSDPKLDRQMFDLTDRLLERAGFQHYEISNYALPGCESLHNLAYWRGADYHGIGPSAVSTVRGWRRTNGKFTAAGWRVAEEEHLTSATLASEHMALGLRTDEGIDESRFTARFGFSPGDRWQHEIETLRQHLLMTPAPDLRLTPQGRRLADEIAVQFMP